MNPKLLSHDTGLPVRAIRALEKAGVISSNLTDDEFFFLCTFSKVWCNTELLKLQIAPLELRERAAMMFGAGHSKWEQWIINRFLAHIADRRQTEDSDGRRYLPVKLVVSECMGVHDLPKNMEMEVTRRAYALRKKVYNQLQRHDDLAHIARHLTTGLKKKKARTVAAGSNKRLNEVRELLGYN